MSVTAISLTLPRDPSASRTARDAVRRTPAVQALDRSRAAALDLIVAELVANAVEHGRGEIRFALREEAGRLYGEVVDRGGGIERRVDDHEAARPAPGDVPARGYGLRLVAALAAAWGVHEGSSHVWFEFALDDPPPPEATAPAIGPDERPDALPLSD